MQIVPACESVKRCYSKRCWCILL